MKGLTQRIITAIIFVAIIAGGIFGGVISFICLAFLIALLCSYELLGILLPEEETSTLKKILSVLITLTPCLYIYSVNQGWISTELSSIGLLGVIGAMILLIELFSRSMKPFATAGSVAITLVYIGVPLALMIDLAQVSVSYDPILIFSIFLFTWVNDTGAFFVGSLIGRHKLFERISPNKTIEGFIGGVLVAMLTGYAFFMLFGKLELTQWLTLAGIVGITATLGDLVESMLKRSMNIKDSGTFLPGHGGFLDRFDGFIFAIPFAYMYLRLFI